ncbi:MAG: dTDP-glucose 4,6-dehydratase [Candidatus Helarchaeota archaeon]
MIDLKYLVTGGFGFIGSNFIINLLSEGKYFVVNVDKIGVGANLQSLEKHEENPFYKFKKMDISNKHELDQLEDSIDVIVNFAADTHVDRSINDPKPFLENNYLGTFNLLEAIRKSNRNIQYIQISTDEVYGDILEGSFTETSQLNPSNPYSATKAAADLLCNSYQRTYGLDIKITRCTNNFGPNQFPEKLIPKTILRALNDRKIPVYGTGKNIRDWLYVQDHCEAIKTVIDKGKSGEVYNISSGNEKTVLDIVHIILDYLDKPESLITYVEDRPGHDLRYSLDSAKLRKLGWKPKHSFEEAIKQTIDWYLENPEWWEPLLTDQILAETPWKK